MTNKNTPNPLTGHKRYEKISYINKGSFGFVMKAKDKVSGRYVAIKFIPRGDHIQDYVEREILNHKALRHPHVVQFHEIFLTEDYLAIVMEYADKGDLFMLVQQTYRLPEDFARWIFQQLIFGLDYCHRRGVANRDVKLENILLQAGNNRPLVKLCDFGYSKSEEWDSVPKSRVGTPDYMAPEIIKNIEGNYSAKLSDIWSCGVVLYVMLVGQYPFSRDEDFSLSENKRQKVVLTRILSLDYIIPDYLSSEAHDLIKKTLVDDPSKRLETYEIMQHPWYKKDLPPDALKMNDVYVRAYTSSGIQSNNDIRTIMAAAKTIPNQSDPIELPDIEVERIITNEIETHSPIKD